MAEVETYVSQLPGYEITLKQISMSDTITGQANVCNLNATEIARLLNIFCGAINELSLISDVNEYIDSTILRIETDKKVFPILFSLSVETSPQQVTFFDTVYDINRVDDYTYTIAYTTDSSTTDTWNVSNLISQVKDSTGLVANVAIRTANNMITVSFQNIPDTDYYLYVM